MTDVLPYGAWPSVISAASLVEGVVTPAELVVDGTDIWWSESRPTEGGRIAVMRWRDGDVTEITPPDANVRTQVHEYGGGAWWVAAGVLVYSELTDGRLRRLEPGDRPLPITPEPDQPRALRFADGRPDPDGRWYVCVRERHTGTEPVNEIVAVALDGSGAIDVLVSGADFYSSPRLDADGTRLAWVQWDHPNMPWDSSELWVAELETADSGSLALGVASPIAGGGDHSVGEPQWGPAGHLYFLSDTTGWSNLYRSPGTSDGDGSPELIVGGEFDIGRPHWVFGGSRYVVRSDEAVLAALGRPGGDVLYSTADEAVSGWTVIDALRLDSTGQPVLLGATHAMLPVVARPGDPPELISTPAVHGVGPGYLPGPEAISFPTTAGCNAHALFYRPANPDVEGPPGELPPLLVLAHGGPTGAARRQLQLALRFWTSRGWAVVDVDYRGSVGYGRPYMRALDGKWGVVDVEDCVAAARYLVDRGEVDGDRLAIRGGSAGGFTVLAALAFHDVFAAGASRYGVADLEALAADTHKFEARYLDRLVGPYPAASATYRSRSPIHHTEGLRAPMILLQGGEDKVVPPSQAEALAAALEEAGVTHAYLLFPDEGHGFRAAETVITALEAEETFFARVFGFEPATGPVDIEIVNG